MKRAAFTLVELIVVLAVMGLAVALVAPAFLSPASDATSPLAPVLREARRTAISRGEALWLQIDPIGRWELLSRGSDPAVLAGGRLDQGPRSLEIVFSPLGACAPTPETAMALDPLVLDALTCEVWSP